MSTADNWIGHGLRIGEYVVERGQRLDHAARIDAIAWSVWVDVTYVKTGWRGRLHVSDVETVKGRIED
jgi:hypothetical protein